MAKLIAFNNLSLDGFFADAAGSLDWAHRDGAEMTDYVKKRGGAVGCHPFGRRTYQMFASFWPTPAGQASNPHFAQRLNDSPKVVFSRTLKTAAWQHSRVEPAADAKTLKKLKAGQGGDCMLFGSGELVRSLTAQGLIDEYQLLVNPVLLGAGKPLFNPLPKAVELRLIEAEAFKNGTVLLRYGAQK
jgi:dihydrofolate reductase